LCHQHVHKHGVSLALKTLEDVPRLRELTDMGKVHIAQEFTAVAVASLGEKNYNARIIAGYPHCKNSTGPDQLQLINAHIAVWWSDNGPHIKYGPLWTFVCDGASIRRWACVLIFETNELASTSPIFSRLAPLKLLDRTVRTK
jgi:hypothetical protein